MPPVLTNSSPPWVTPHSQRGISNEQRLAIPYTDDSRITSQTPAPVPKPVDTFKDPASLQPPPQSQHPSEPTKVVLMLRPPPPAGHLCHPAREQPTAEPELAGVVEPVGTFDLHSPNFKDLLEPSSSTLTPWPPRQGNSDEPNLFDTKLSRPSAISRKTPAQVSNPVDTSEHY